jgi:hypothetical protein
MGVCLNSPELRRCVLTVMPTCDSVLNSDPEGMPTDLFNRDIMRQWNYRGSPGRGMRLC